MLHPFLPLGWWWEVVPRYLCHLPLRFQAQEQGFAWETEKPGLNLKIDPKMKVLHSEHVYSKTLIILQVSKINGDS